MNNKISDYQVKEIKEMIEEKILILQPDFQRKYIWDNEKKINLIDSILREWVLPPILCVKNSENGKLEVIDGQQRLTSIHNFITNKYSYKSELLFSELSRNERSKILNYKLVFFVIEDIDNKTIGEYFYRLNDQVALTSTEKRNAYNGDFKDIVKSLVNNFINKGFNKNSLKISNQRFEYEDIVSRLIVYVQEKDLDIDIDILLNDYYKGLRVIKNETVKKTSYAMDNFCKILSQLNNNEDIGLWNETNVLTSLYVLSEYPDKYTVNQSDFNTFLIDFERKRCEVELDIQSKYANNLIKAKYNELFKMFNSYMTHGSMTNKSIRSRELILRLLFLNNFEFLFFNQKAVSIKEEVLFDSLINDCDLYSNLDIELMLNDYLNIQ